MANETTWSQDLGNVLGGLAGAWAQVETAKGQTALAKAQASWAAMGLPNAHMNPQALAGGYVAMPGTGGVNNMMPILLIGGGLIAVVLLLSKS